MPLTFSLPSNEEVLFERMYHPNRKIEPFGVVLTREALYILQKKWFARSDPWHYVRLPLCDIQVITVSKSKRLWLWIISVFLIAIGGYTSFLMIDNLRKGMKTPVNHHVFLVFLIGLAIPLAMRGRYSLRIDCPDRHYSWSPPLFAVFNRTEGNNLISDLTDSCKKNGIFVLDKRG